MPEPTQSPPSPPESAILPVQDRVTIPKEKYAPKPEKKPAYKPKSTNFADNAETVKKVLDWVKSYRSDFEAQSQRTQYLDTEMDIADEMYRAAKVRAGVESDQSDNKEDTRSNVSSTSFYRTVKVITAGETAVILGNDEQLPVQYEPLHGADDYLEAEGRAIARDQNMTLAYTFDAARLRSKLRQSLLRVNKYGNLLCEMVWRYRKEIRTERVPTGFENDEETGMRRPTGFKFETKERIADDYPDFVIHDMKDCWFDCMIDDVQEWSAFGVRKYKQLGEIWDMQRTSEFTNVGKIKNSHLYAGESPDNTVQTDRQANAGEESDASNVTTLFDVHDWWVRVPVDDETGSWEPEKEIPRWYNVVFVGDLDKAPVCVKLTPNPHFCKKVPFLLFHSHDDDKGALHLGHSTLLKCLYMMETTVFNQAFDNNTQRNQVPLIVDRGSLSVRSKVFTAGGNKLWELTPGSRDPREVAVQDTTQQSVNFVNIITDMLKDTAGTNKPFLGEPLGSRTSASEAIAVLEQAVKPALEEAKYKAEQLLTFIAFWNQEYWRQYGDPRRTLIITQGGERYQVKPTELWGPLNIRITAIKNFQDGIIRRKEEDQFLNQYFPIAKEYMKPSGIIHALAQIAKNRGYEGVDTWWNDQGDFDARHVARSENQAILFDGVYDMPKPGENHAAHLQEHKPGYANWMVGIPDEEKNPVGDRYMKLHIQMHEQFTEREKAKQATAAQQMPQEQPVGPRSPGEGVGDLLGAAAGGEENLSAVPGEEGAVA